MDDPTSKRKDNTNIKVNSQRHQNDDNGREEFSKFSTILRQAEVQLGKYRTDDDNISKEHRTHRAKLKGDEAEKEKKESKQLEKEKRVEFEDTINIGGEKEKDSERKESMEKERIEKEIREREERENKEKEEREKREKAESVEKEKKEKEEKEREWRERKKEKVEKEKRKAKREESEKIVNLEKFDSPSEGEIDFSNFDIGRKIEKRKRKDTEADREVCYSTLCPFLSLIIKYTFILHVLQKLRKYLEAVRVQCGVASYSEISPFLQEALVVL